MFTEEIVLFNERIINMITKSIGDIMVLYPINTNNVVNVVEILSNESVCLTKQVLSFTVILSDRFYLLKLF